MPPEAPAPRYGYGPSLLPATEVYTVLRENGFSPLGIPRLRGSVYTIAVIDRRGDDGRLVIDARDGRIVRFLPARGIGPAIRRRCEGALWAAGSIAAADRQPRRAEAAGPDSACRQPRRAGAEAEPACGQAGAGRGGRGYPEPAPAQQATVAPPVAAAPPKPAEAQATAQAAAPTVGQAPPPATPAASAILPTQEMPNVQALE